MTGPAELPPGVIPYVEAHTGPRRLLALDLDPGTGRAGAIPRAAIDGREYLVVWGRVVFEIPADRAVHVSVHLQVEGMSWARSTLVPPGPEPLTYAYTTGGLLSGTGSLTRTG